MSYFISITYNCIVNWAGKYRDLCKRKLQQQAANKLNRFFTSIRSYALTNNINTWDDETNNLYKCFINDFKDNKNELIELIYIHSVTTWNNQLKSDLLTANSNLKTIANANTIFSYKLLNIINQKFSNIEILKIPPNVV